MSRNLQIFRYKDWVALGRNSFEPPYKVSDALVNEARLVYVVQGESTLTSAQKQLKLQSQDLLIMKTDNFINQWHKMKDNAWVKVIVFQIKSDLLSDIYDEQLPSWFQSDSNIVPDSLLRIPSNPSINAFFSSLTTYMNQTQMLSEEILRLKMKELITLLLQIDQNGAIGKIFRNLFQAPDYAFQEIIQQNLFNDLHVEDLAFLSNMSLSSFKRKFNQIYGTSPNKYIISKRLEKAHTLLRTSNLNITEIAYDCGFSEVGYFSKTFKKHFELAPSDLRKKIQHENI